MGGLERPRLMRSSQRNRGMKVKAGLVDDDGDCRYVSLWPSTGSFGPQLSGHSVISVLIGWVSRNSAIWTQYSGGSDLLRTVRYVRNALNARTPWFNSVIPWAGATRELLDA